MNKYLLPMHYTARQWHVLAGAAGPAEAAADPALRAAAVDQRQQHHRVPV